MKKHGISILLLFLAIILGCSKNSPSEDNNPKSIDKTANLLATGDSANDILSNDVFDNLQIEIAYVNGFRPTQEAINELLLYLNQRTFKENIEVIYTQLESPNEESLNLDEISDLENKNRTAYNNGNTLAIYIYFADAPSEDDDADEGLVTLGAVYRNTSMIVYESTVRDLASKSFLISIADVEISTLNHEFGHLFGLVNLGTEAVNAHEDTEAKNHCNVQGCLMRAELQFGGGSQNKNSVIHGKGNSENGLQIDCALSGKSVLKMLEQQASKGLAKAPDLDSECILDLQANGGK